MRIIISPAKKMNINTDALGYRDLPEFLPQTELILARLKEMSYDELKKLWKCSDKISEQNYVRLQNMDLRRVLTPAILSYEGIQYQYMAPAVFSGEEYDYIQEHLRILSGFYGVLKPFDGVVPYRLEMQAKLAMPRGELEANTAADAKAAAGGEAKDLYEFWGSTLADKLAKETDCILNLASKEYSISISKHLPKDFRFITCVFGEEIDGKIIEKGTLCKMARGEMVRRMAEQRIEDPEDIKKLQFLDYKYSEEYSDDKNFAFKK